MTNWLTRPLAYTAAFGLAGAFGLSFLQADGPPKPAEPAKAAPVAFTNEVVATPRP